MKTIGRDFGDTARKVYAVASGALGNGKTCVVNSNGTVSVIEGTTAAIGSGVEFDTTGAVRTSAAYDSNSDRVVITYQGENNYGTAIVGTVNAANNSISFGTAVVFNAVSTQTSDWGLGLAFDSNVNKFAIAYWDSGGSSNGEVRVGTVDPSDNSISFGSVATLHTGQTTSNTVIFDSNANKFLFMYQAGASGEGDSGRARVGTISGTDISFGTEVTFESNATHRFCGSFDTTANKIATGYVTGDAFIARVATISGTDVTFGTATTVLAGAGNAGQGQSVAYDPDNNKSVYVLSDTGNFNSGAAYVATISGTDITVGSKAKFVAAGAVPENERRPLVVYDTAINRPVISYVDFGVTGRPLTFKVGTISGTTISFGDSTLFDEGENLTSYTGMVYDPDQERVVASFRSNSSRGEAVVYKPGFTNLTSENFIGITPSAYPTGAGAEIQTKGAVNEEQSGLTAGQSYFVQTDGTLSTTAGDPSVFAGTAVSATKIIVKG